MVSERLAADTEHGVSLRNERAAMAAEILRRKLRNFPVANLSQRIASA
jgi:hypothetical protein